jgi:transposase
LIRGEPSDEAWQIIIPFLPPQRGGVGRPPSDHRPVVNGMLWVLRTGAPWRDLPEEFGKWNSVADSDEVAPAYRDDCAPGFRHDVAPWDRCRAGGWIVGTEPVPASIFLSIQLNL